jgi:hypothetical protein
MGIIDDYFDDLDPSQYYWLEIAIGEREDPDTGIEPYRTFKRKLAFTWYDDYLQHKDSMRPKVSIPMMAFYTGISVEDLLLDIVDV